MLVTPRPGTNRDNLLKALQSVHNEVFNLRGGGGPSTAHKRMLSYLEWTSSATRMLGNQITGADLERLVLTERYKLLLSAAGTMTGTEIEVQRVVNGLVSQELDERVQAFDETVKTLQALGARWSPVGDFVLPDTSFYINNEHKLREADLGALAKFTWNLAHVIVPIVIVDELDSLKESKDRHVRWRAGHTLGVLDEVFARTTDIGLLRPADTEPGSDGLTRSAVTIELVFDPPGHVRLPINDDEIIDRALAIESLADRKITILTYDTGQAMRARSAGLRVFKLRKQSVEEP